MTRKLIVVNVTKCHALCFHATDRYSVADEVAHTDISKIVVESRPYVSGSPASAAIVVSDCRSGVR